MTHPELAWLSYLVRLTDIPHTEVAAWVLDAGRVYGAQVPRVSGVWLRRWAAGLESAPLWAYRGALDVAARLGYVPRSDSEIAAVARTLRATGPFNIGVVMVLWPRRPALWSSLLDSEVGVVH